MICASGLMCRSRVRLISSVGPRVPSFIKWNSSATTQHTSDTSSARWRNNESNFSEVQTRMLQSSMFFASAVASPMPSPTEYPIASATALKSSYFSIASALSGTM